MRELNEIITQELRHFRSDEQREAFQRAQVEPYVATEVWSYGDEEHRCHVVARDNQQQIVYCPTGFGPAFPWAAQRIGARDLGTDGEWCAYLYEAFMTSTLWRGKADPDFVLMGPGERV